MFLIFDIIVLNGDQVGPKPLPTRLDAIRQVVAGYRSALEKKAIPADHPFSIMGKQFMPTQDLPKLISMLKHKEGHRYYIDQRRHHLTDGLIFTPIDDPYTPRTCRSLFKWKYIEELSIDLKAVYNRYSGSIAWSCGFSEGVDQDYPITLLPKDLDRLSRYMSAQKDQNFLIVEVCFDLNHKMWKFKMIRTDKAKANHIRVVEHTVKVIHENLGLTELSKLLSLPKKPNPL